MTELKFYTGIFNRRLAWVVGWCCALSAQAQDGPSIDHSLSAGPQKLACDHLPNAIRIHPRIISGGLPADEAAFAELKHMGIRTVISVDGAVPDVEMARRFGLRYVHLPHGYSGIPETRVAELAKAVRELDGQVYIHCHHGKHRSPAASAAACVSAGMIPAGVVADILKMAGTNANYRGLFASALAARPIAPKTLDALQVDFVERAAVPPMAEAMVSLEDTFAKLKRASDAGWQLDSSSDTSQHPITDIAHESLLLREHFTELLRTPDTQKYDSEFSKILRTSQTAALELEQLLGNQPLDRRQITKQLELVESSCQACHSQYRDAPVLD